MSTPLCSTGCPRAKTKHGFVVTRLDEPQPLEEGVRVHPPMKKHERVPQVIVIEATKTSG